MERLPSFSERCHGVILLLNGFHFMHRMDNMLFETIQSTSGTWFSIHWLSQFDWVQTYESLYQITRYHIVQLMVLLFDWPINKPTHGTVPLVQSNTNLGSLLRVIVHIKWTENKIYWMKSQIQTFQSDWYVYVVFSASSEKPQDRKCQLSTTGVTSNLTWTRLQPSERNELYKMERCNWAI